MASRFKGAIFDMDGTILDSMGHWRSLNVEFLKKRGLPIPEEIRGREMVTSSTAAAKLYVEKFDLSMTWQQIIEEFEACMWPRYRTVIGPKPGAARCVRTLRAAGFRLCVATLTPQKVAEMALERQGLLECFEFVACSADIGLKKSSPEFFHHIAGRLGLEAAECVVFEDAAYAMRGAKAAGCAVVAVEDPSAAPYLGEIREICDLYLADYNLFTLEALECLDRGASCAV